jgi:hypothetical protein
MGCGRCVVGPPIARGAGRGVAASGAGAFCPKTAVESRNTKPTNLKMVDMDVIKCLGEKYREYIKNM